MSKMMKLIMVSLFSLVLNVAAFAQGAFVNHTAPTAFQGYSDTVYKICPTNDAAPCTTTPIYSDITLTTVISQSTAISLPGDKKAKFYIAPGTYVIQFQSAQGGSGYFAETFQAGSGQQQALGGYQGATPVAITDTAFHALIAAASDIKIPANYLAVGRTLHVHAKGVYTNAAASLLNGRVDLCTVSGCATGTDFAAAGCAIVTTNQANNLTNGQWTLDCDLTGATAGASGTLMAKGLFSANLGAATTAVQSVFADTAVALSAAVDTTVAEFVNISFKFSTSNASNFATIDEATVVTVK